eukprot:2977645-Lingulodinium_polyedra.AAC.1
MEPTYPKHEGQRRPRNTYKTEVTERFGATLGYLLARLIKTPQTAAANAHLPRWRGRTKGPKL